MLGSINLNPEGDKVKCPTLVIGGIHDAVRPPETAKAVADSIPGSRYVGGRDRPLYGGCKRQLFLELALPFLGMSSKFALFASSSLILIEWVGISTRLIVANTRPAKNETKDKITNASWRLS